MIKDFRAYESGDILKMKPKDIYAGDPELLTRIEQIASVPDSYCNTFINDKDEPIAIIGLSILWPGVADVWAVTSEEVKKEPISFHKRVKHALDFYMEELKIRKYQVYVKAEFSVGIRWMGSFGFKVEGLLEKFGPEGKDYFVMGRVN